MSYLASIPEPWAWLLVGVGIVGCALGPMRRVRSGYLIVTVGLPKRARGRTRSGGF